MSLNSIMNIGVSGLMTAQEQLRVTSDNISNVNTPGYIRKQANQTSVTVGGKGAGVTSGQITLAADRYLQQASFKAASEASQSTATYDLLDQIQAQFGDITDENNLFNQMNSALTSMAKAGETPSSSALRQEVLSNLTGFLAEGGRISDKIQQVRADADARIASDVTAINDLLKNISKLNASISSATVVGGDATGAQSAQTGYIDQLSKLIDVKVTQNDNGGVIVRTQNGTVLSGDTYATLSYQPTSTVSSSTSFNSIMIKGISGETRDFGDSITSGELKGLIDMRDTTAPAINDQLNQYMAKFTEQMNAAHNDSSSVPAPTALNGKALSQTQAEALNGMTGISNIVMLDSAGAIANRMEINFSANTWTRYPASGAPVSGTFADASFAADIQAGSGGGLTLGFTGGALSVNAAGTTAGVAIADPATGGSNKLGQGFSQYFGLNDLISSSVPTSNQTGLTATSAHGFVGGSQMSFSIKGENGSTIADVDFTIPTTGVTTVDDLRVALNNTSTGVGRYGTFSLDSTTGALTFSGYGSPAAQLAVSSDNTSRNGGASFSTFFGIGGTSGKVASSLSINATVNGNPSRMALAQVNLSATSPNPALVSGDGSGGLAMSDIANASITFPKTGLNGGGPSTLERYASDLAGQVGNLAANAETNKTASEALLKEATNRRSATEGVNLDEELINLTIYQQAYGASGRLIQAVKEMYDVLLNMGR